VLVSSVGSLSGSSVFGGEAINYIEIFIFYKCCCTSVTNLHSGLSWWSLKLKSINTALSPCDHHACFLKLDLSSLESREDKWPHSRLLFVHQKS
jgi:hypothetical protein